MTQVADITLERTSSGHSLFVSIDLHKHADFIPLLKDKRLILKSHPKAKQSKLLYLVSDILKEPRNIDATGNPEQLKYTKKRRICKRSDK